MSRRLAAGGLVLLALFAAAGCGDKSPIGTAGENYTVELPDGWDPAPPQDKEAAAVQAGGVIEGATVQDVVVTSLWLDGDFGDLETSNLVVIREPVPDGVSFDRFVDASIKNVERLFGSAVESVEKTEDTVVAGQPAPTFDYKLNSQGTTLTKRLVLIEHDGLSYGLTANPAPGSEDDTLATLDAIASSWTWTD